MEPMNCQFALIYFAVNDPACSSISVTRKNRQISIKVAKNDFTTYMIDFNTFTKIASECWEIGAN